MKINICKVRYGKILAVLYFSGKMKNNFIDFYKPQRFLVFCYGLPGKPLDENSQIVKKFLEKNFIIVCPEYIGTFSSYGRFCVKGVVETILETIKFLKKGEAIELWNLKKVCWRVKDITLIGGSFGGVMALVVGAKSKEVKNIIAIASPSNLREQGKLKGEENLENLYDVIKRGWENIWRIRSKKDWDEFIKGESDINPVDHVKELRNKNIFLIHGQKDKTVSVKRSVDLFEELKKGKKEYKLLILKNEGHCNNYILAKKKVFKEVLSF